MRVDVSRIPEQFKYLRSAVARYGYLGHNEVILDFLEQKTDADLECLRQVAETVARNDDMDAINAWIRRVSKHVAGRRLGQAVNNMLALVGELGFSVAPDYLAMPIEDARQRVRHKWQTARPYTFAWLAAQTAKIFPSQEGRQLILAAIARLPSSTSDDAAFALNDFPCRENLVVIHQLRDEFELHRPPSAAWGFLAALSGIDLSLVKVWLAEGPPLSFIALDALRACYRYETPDLQASRPKLLDSNHEQLTEELKAHLDRCESPLERRRSGILLRHVDEIIAK